MMCCLIVCLFACLLIYLSCACLCRIVGAPDSVVLPLDDFILEAEFAFLCGDTSHHLAFTYLKCGKLMYAVEECESAISTYTELQHRYSSLKDTPVPPLSTTSTDTCADTDTSTCKVEEMDTNNSSGNPTVMINILDALRDSTRSLYPNEGTGQRGMPGLVFRLRHAWGLMAVVRCQRREQALSTEALAQVQRLQPGPVEDRGDC
jgi:hypothetical protein